MKVKILILAIFICGALAFFHEENASRDEAQLGQNENAPFLNRQITDIEKSANRDVQIAQTDKGAAPLQVSPPSLPPYNSDIISKNGIGCEMGPEMDAGQLARELMAIFSEVWPGKNLKADPGETHSNMVAGIVEKGDTVSKILDSAAAGESSRYIAAMRKVFSPGAFRTGQPYTVITDPDSGRVIRFEYEINRLRKLVVEGGEYPKARFEDIHYTTILEVCAGIVEDNLFQAVADAGEEPQLAVRLAELFGSEINFVKDLQEGDSFVVLLEKRYRNGKYGGYGRILAARFINKGRAWEAYLFRDAEGNPHYYNARGENLKKTLLQAPLAITRLTSKFSHNRKHPVLGISRPHLGVDYGAPIGTPVKAVGDGTVTSRGWAGGYGNQIILKHSSGLESQYAHLSKFANGLKKGQKVRQGQVIGYVGSTGLSTGPHLDFRLRQNGIFINPAKAINPRGEPVALRLMEKFRHVMLQERSYLDGHRLPRNYHADMLVPIKMAVKDIDNQPRINQKTKKRATDLPVRKNRHFPRKRS